MRIRVYGCMALLVILLLARIFLGVVATDPPPPTFIETSTDDFRAGSARTWLREYERNQVQLERTILRAENR